jgi:hypothetical protein
MLTPTRGIPLDALVAGSNASRLQRVNLNQANTSFTQQLAESLEGYLNGASVGSHLEIDVLPSSAGNSGTRQFLVTVKGADSPTNAATVLSTSVPSATPIATTVAPPASAPLTNEVDAYWAMQPKEVQALRTVEDPDERAAMAQKLSNQGFAIDPNIMIHRWDPYMTMKIRQGEGYTWVPALGQSGIPVSPGLTFPGLASYDPNSPPPGAIHVSTDFAVGLEHTSPGAGNTNFSHTPQS